MKIFSEMKDSEKKIKETIRKLRKQKKQSEMAKIRSDTPTIKIKVNELNLPLKDLQIENKNQAQRADLGIGCL